MSYKSDSWDFLELIGASPSSWRLFPSELSSLINKARSGGALSEIDLKNLKEKVWSSIQPFHDEDGSPFVLYIFDQSFWYFRKYKFHFCWCSTLEMMKNIGRRPRYKAKYDIDNPEFKVKYSSERLKVCINCLNQFKHDDYNPPAPYDIPQRMNQFNMRGFFEKFGRQDLMGPTHQAHSHDYPPDWPKIALEYKKSVSWRCENCFRDCGSNKKELHVHHKNGVKDDNGIPGYRPNLTALCTSCHSKVDHLHSFIRKNVSVEDLTK